MVEDLSHRHHLVLMHVSLLAVKSYLQEVSAPPTTHQGKQQPLSALPVPPSQTQRLHAPTPALPVGRVGHGDITALLGTCRVVPVREEEVCPPCYLPPGFWDVCDHVPDVEWFSGDLEWK